MSADPLDVLRSPGPGPAADPEFKAALRERLLAAASTTSDAPTTGDHPVDDGAVIDLGPPTTRPADAEVRGRKRHVAIAAAAVVVAAALLTALLVANRDGSDALKVVDTTTSGPVGSSTVPSVSTTTSPAGADLPAIQPPEAAGAQTTEIGKFVGTLAVDGETLWVFPDSRPVERYDKASMQLLGTVPIVNSIAQRPVFGFGSMWATTELDDTLWRVDRATGQVVASLAIPPDIRGASYVSLATVAATDDAIWVVSFGDKGSKLIKVDPASNTVVGSIPAPASAANVIYADGSFWVLSSQGPLQRIDPADGHVQASFPMQAEWNTTLRAGLGSIWTNDVIDGVDTIVRIDPVSNTVQASIPNGPAQDFLVREDVAFAGGFAWSSSGEALLFKIDPTTNTIVARYGAASGGAGLTADDNAVWFTNWAGHTLYKIPAY